MKRKKLLALLLTAAVSAGILSGCNQQEAAPEDTVLSDAQAAELRNARGRSVQYAENFAITYLEGEAKLVTDSAGRELLLLPQGAAVPAGYENAIPISVPVKRVMLASPTQAGFLEALGNESLYDSIAAVTVDSGQWTIPQIQERMFSGQIQHIPQELWMAGDVSGILAAAPDLVFTDMSSEAGRTLCGILDSLGIQYAAVSEDRETDTGAYMEWLKFFGAFFAIDDQANEVYRNTMDRVHEIYGSLAAIPVNEQPVVAYGRVYGGVVYTQSGNSAIAQQIKKVGAVYALEELEGTGAVKMSLEDFMDECRDADILIYDQMSGYIPGTLLEEWEQFAEFKAFQNQRIYTLDNRYPMNCVKITEKLMDLAAICHPETAEGHVFTMYQPLQRY